MSTEQEVVKKPNALVEYTEEQEESLIRCKDDPMYFIRNYVMIQHPLKGGVLFEPYPYQEEMLDAFHNYNKVVALTGRQQGKSVDNNTIISVDGKKTKIKKLLNMRFKDRFVTFLETILVNLKKSVK